MLTWDISKLQDDDEESDDDDDDGEEEEESEESSSEPEMLQQVQPSASSHITNPWSNLLLETIQEEHSYAAAAVLAADLGPKSLEGQI